MTWRRLVFAALLAATAIGGGWVLFVGLPRWYAPPAQLASPPPEAPKAPESVRKIKVRLFGVDASGTRLVSQDRDVAFAASVTEQARRIVEAQLALPSAGAGDAAATPLVSAVPADTTLRALFVDRGTAYVDLSHEVSTGHPGGVTAELLTIYTFVQVLTTNLPAVTAVQVLVDGKEADTLAGHIDIRRPLPRSDEWVASAPAPASAPASDAAPGAASDRVAAPATPPR